MNDKTNDKTNEKGIFFLNCKLCSYITSNKCNYERHLLTAKHLKMTINDKKEENEIKEKKPKNIIFECDCGNIYKYRQGLFAHKKKCNIKLSIPENTIENTKNIVNSVVIMEMFKENQEFKNLLIEQCKQSEFQQKKMFELQQENHTLMNKMVEISQNCLTVPTTIHNNNTTNNTNNTQFNIQLFLNETCKNAINFTDFIGNIQVTDNDLENNAKMGFVEGVTKIIMDNLKQLELTNRPIHCTDVKRETIYVKEEDEWDKEKSHNVIQKGIQEITCKNMCQLSEWRENNPEYEDMDTELGEKSIVMQQNSMAGFKCDVFYPKIIKNIAKETIISNKSSLIKK